MKNRFFISEKLIDWYAINHRDLPWRHINDPYRIWISEIILQQTRVAQGLEYYERFVRRFPDVRSLAEAPEQEVLKYWQGLGYYSRARNLHATARSIVNEYGGEFPHRYADVLHLKGIGEYTAAAIVSFAWNLPYPVVDGNVFRFLSRLFAIDEPIDSTRGRNYFTKLAAELMDRSKAGAFNQAIMEFGALQCVPSLPDCAICPFHDECLAYAERSIAAYPVKRNKTRTRDRYLYYFHVHDKEYLYLKQRRDKGIWQNMFEFPVIESEKPLTFDEIIRNASFSEWFAGETADDFRLKIENRKHVLSHRILYATFYELILNRLSDPPEGFIRIARAQTDNYPVHRLMQFYLEKMTDLI
ncbi:MAG: A/G-specific adenine glycosylase [Dysgonamonadaceae bacterium]|jgi:A/G-specific adenine glycosylase|nr:A/G-specific adenine glycosylase [Dysgonamonadaceae bacterium]